MTEPRQPEDHKAKKVDPAPVDEYFTFEFDGTMYTMPHKTLDKITPGWVRRHRSVDASEFLWQCLEALATPDDGLSDPVILETFDRMTGSEGRKTWRALVRDFDQHLGASLGE